MVFRVEIDVTPHHPIGHYSSLNDGRSSDRERLLQALLRGLSDVGVSVKFEELPTAAPEPPVKKTIIEVLRDFESAQVRREITLEVSPAEVSAAKESLQEIHKLIEEHVSLHARAADLRIKAAELEGELRATELARSDAIKMAADYYDMMKSLEARAAIAEENFAALNKCAADKERELAEMTEHAGDLECSVGTLSTALEQAVEHSQDTEDTRAWREVLKSVTR